MLSCHMECNALCSSCQPAKITCLTPQLITSAHRQNTFYLAINKDHFKSHTLAFYVDVCFCVFDVFLCVLLSSNHSLLFCDLVLNNCIAGAGQEMIFSALDASFTNHFLKCGALYKELMIY